MKYNLLILLSFIFFAFNLNATHNRSGSITYKHLFGNTYEFTIKTCTFINEADREFLNVKWGDNTSDTIQRDNFIDNSIYQVRENTYIGTHAYTGPGTFTISVEDPNRNSGVVNISNSVNQVFCIQSELIISPFIGAGNNSIVILDCPCPEFACVGESYYYNLSAFDVDGDSLSYSIVPCRGENCMEMSIPLVYNYPDLVGGGTMSIDPVTGTLNWQNPNIAGEYNLAIKISEYRNGIYIGSVILDMQLTVKDCQNQPPQIVRKEDTCVFAGDVISINFTANDPGDNIHLFASGNILNLANNPAIFTENTSANTVVANFDWIPDCNQASQTYYSLILHAEDFNPEVQLTDLETFKIKVKLPPVENLSVEPFGGSFNLNWSPYALNCDSISYRIYRSNDSVFSYSECCDHDLIAAMGYELIGETSDTLFNDNQFLEIGNEYCYLVTAVNPFDVESCISNQICNKLLFETPVITNVSVMETDNLLGKDSIYWSWPKELNIANFPGPYYYELYRGVDFSNSFSELIYTTPTNADINLVDTLYFDSELNTLDEPYVYYVSLYSGTSLVGQSSNASSIYLNSTPNDNQLTLTWEEFVPWINSEYKIYKETPTSSGNFILIDSTSNDVYTDSNLINLETYCYKIESYGDFDENGIRSPLINWSQIHCNEPFDFTPPCAPVAYISGDCDLEETTIYWTNPNNSCADDVVKYNLYFAPFQGDSLTFLTQIIGASDTSYIHKDRGSIAGCYYVTAVDSLPYENESLPSNTVCIDNCEGVYNLPNVFTPNGNLVNDLYHPVLPYKFIESIKINIFNRYGELVYTTSDPMINWDGTKLETGKSLVDGVYFYECQVNTITLNGIVSFSLSGNITLLNSK